MRLCLTDKLPELYVSKTRRLEVTFGRERIHHPQLGSLFYLSCAMMASRCKRSASRRPSHEINFTYKEQDQSWYGSNQYPSTNLLHILIRLLNHIKHRQHA